MMRLQRRNVKLMLKLKEVIRKSLRFVLFDDTCSYCHKKLDREGYICSKCLEKLKREAFLKNKDNFYQKAHSARKHYKRRYAFRNYLWITWPNRGA